jgi:hypothetical protein
MEEIKMEEIETKTEELEIKEEENNSQYLIKTSDGENILTSFEIMRMSGMFRTFNTDNFTESEFNVPYPSKIIKYCLMYMEYHCKEFNEVYGRHIYKEISKPLKSNVMRENVSDEWDAIFIDSLGEKMDDLTAIIFIANFLDIQGLLHLACAKLASLIKSYQVEGFKEIFDSKTHL